jgi:hypothetical protein
MHLFPMCLYAKPEFLVIWILLVQDRMMWQLNSVRPIRWNSVRPMSWINDVLSSSKLSPYQNTVTFFNVVFFLCTGGGFLWYSMLLTKVSFLFMHVFKDMHILFIFNSLLSNFCHPVVYGAVLNLVYFFHIHPLPLFALMFFTDNSR